MPQDRTPEDEDTGKKMAMCWHLLEQATGALFYGDLVTRHDIQDPGELIQAGLCGEELLLVL